MGGPIAVHPSGPTLPEEVLRLSVMFDGPVLGAMIDRFALLKADGEAVFEPFLRQELWSADQRTLTLLFEPGRVKSSLLARQIFGPVAAAGERLTLTLDGTPLCSWEVTAGGLPAPEPRRWELAPVAVGTRSELRVDLVEPIDALGCGYLAVIGPDGRQIDGHARLVDQERIWCFAPASSWVAGPHVLRVHPSLENVCGDAIGEAFEHASGASLGARRAVIDLAFEPVAGEAGALPI